MLDRVHLYGVSSENTILDGNENSKIFIIKNIDDFELKNVSIVNGKGKKGAGAYIENSSPQFYNVEFKQNGDFEFDEEKGGAIYAFQSDNIVMRNVNIEENNGLLRRFSRSVGKITLKNIIF